MNGYLIASMIRLILPLVIIGVSFPLGLWVARLRILAAAITAAVSLCFVSVFWFLQYPLVDGNYEAVLKVAPRAIIPSIILSALCAALIISGYCTKRRHLKNQASPPPSARLKGIVFLVAASLVFPAFITQDLIPPAASSAADYYDLLLLEQATISRSQGRHSAYDEYVFETNGRKFYFQACVESDEVLMVSDLYSQSAAKYENHRYIDEDGNFIEPIAIFLRQNQFPYIRGAFLSGNFLYYNHGTEKFVTKSTLNSDLQKSYRIKNFHFAKIDLRTMENIQIGKAEYENAYSQVTNN